MKANKNKTDVTLLCKPCLHILYFSHYDIEKVEKGPKEIFSPEIQKDLLVLEEQEVGVNQLFSYSLISIKYFLVIING